MTENFYYGISGLVLPVTKKDFPPEFKERSRLEYYAHLFNSLEVNSSFYKLPQSKTVAKWKALVPGNFRFTYKLSKTITHAKHLSFNPGEVESFMQVISGAGENPGCILVQLPPSANIDALNQLQELLSELKFHNLQNFTIAVEFRHPSWYEPEVLEIVQEYNAIIVLQDMPKAPTPASYAPGDTIYLRFHGPDGNYRSTYDLETLSRHASQIQHWLTQQKTVYTYFNNTMGAAVENLQTLVKMVNTH